MAESTIIKLQSSDKVLFEVDEAVAYKSETVKRLVVDVSSEAAGTVIPLESVRGDILSKVIEYCKFHVEAAAEAKLRPSEEEDEDEDDEDEDDDSDDDLEDEEKQKKIPEKVREWRKEFVKVDDPILFDMIMAANYLDIKDLLDFLCQTVADMIIGKTPAEVRERFGIPEDLTPEEVEKIKRDNTWAFE